MNKLDTIFAMVNPNGTVRAYTPLNPFNFPGDAADGMAERTQRLSKEKGVEYVALPDYTLLEIWVHEDGMLDLIAEYTGEPCSAPGCQCEEMPYSIFPNGRSPQVMSKDDVLILKLSLIMSGAVRVDENDTVI